MEALPSHLPQTAPAKARLGPDTKKYIFDGRNKKMINVEKKREKEKNAGENKHKPIGNSTNYHTLISAVRAVALMSGNLDRILTLRILSLAVTECLKPPFLHFSFGSGVHGFQGS